ncbi:hypothetical protein NQ317_012258 [Molorchus minor]|uniref:DNA mismatch repair protein S5 domain-containing protein n=1 Tax=Molorchus minor TaxID=1323400 RepID=A0ABQ9K139_9CUCU|nr:hypothetical protein NQ317_012258 [Molorchus minor]
MEAPKIIKLNEEVINRIAAGEVIQRPANALKELIENSLDPKATNIQLMVKNGGLKLLQIQDNGTGIRKEDFEIVCERFTTSKLREFEDLHKISTYGFRGEALASISHIAHLTITSKTKHDICAYQASFVDSKLQGTPKPVAGNQGTIITVEDLFYNMTVRKKALRSPAEEYQKISEVVSKYAIHNSTVGFALKKSGDNNDIRTPPESNAVENIRIIYGNTIARELIEFSLESTPFKFKVHGYMTNVNYSTKKLQFLLFINHRLVDCQSLKKCVDHVYSTYLPKNMHPFVYLSLELDPGDIDINVHPTKHEVHFFKRRTDYRKYHNCSRDKIVGFKQFKSILHTSKDKVYHIKYQLNSCVIFLLNLFIFQAKLPKVFNVEPNEVVPDKVNGQNKSINPKDMVRTDSKEQKLQQFFGPSIRKENIMEENKDTNISITEEEFQKHHEHFLERNEKFEDMLLDKTEVNIVEGSPKAKLSDVENKACKSKDLIEYNKDLPKKSTSKVETKLSSVLELRKQIEDNCNRVLRETFAQHVFVGSVNPSQALIQHSTKLFLCNTQTILTELFYQFILYNFQNFDCYKFSDKIPIYELAMICLELPDTGWTPEDGEKSALAKRITEILVDKGPMLLDYFSIEIDEQGNLCSIPILLENYIPDPAALPLYVVRLATEVNWESEKECFETFSRETAKFYSQVSKETNEHGKDWKWITEYVLYPAIKQYFIPPKTFTENAAIFGNSQFAQSVQGFRKMLSYFCMLS